MKTESCSRSNDDFQKWPSMGQVSEIKVKVKPGTA